MSSGNRARRFWRKNMAGSILLGSILFFAGASSAQSRLAIVPSDDGRSLCTVAPDHLATAMGRRIDNPWKLEGYVVASGKVCKLMGSEVLRMVVDFSIGFSPVASRMYEPTSACMKALLEDAAVPSDAVSEGSAASLTSEQKIQQWTEAFGLAANGPYFKKTVPMLIPNLFLIGPVDGMKEGIRSLVHAQGSEQAGIALWNASLNGVAIIPVAKGITAGSATLADLFAAAGKDLAEATLRGPMGPMASPVLVGGRALASGSDVALALRAGSETCFPLEVTPHDFIAPSLMAAAGGSESAPPRVPVKEVTAKMMGEYFTSTRAEYFKPMLPAAELLKPFQVRLFFRYLRQGAENSAGRGYGKWWLMTDPYAYQMVRALGEAYYGNVPQVTQWLDDLAFVSGRVRELIPGWKNLRREVLPETEFVATRELWLLKKANRLIDARNLNSLDVRLRRLTATLKSLGETEYPKVNPQMWRSLNWDRIDLELSALDKRIHDYRLMMNQEVAIADTPQAMGRKLDLLRRDLQENFGEIGNSGYGTIKAAIDALQSEVVFRLDPL